ncbi:hypothetical protein ACOQFL_17230 [Actinopolyspora sp. H202]|uniref:hypothetical protein n=1 Tax=Actinopolyspora sp. H202 TaxID=1500456 RepID=UPI003EE5C814
MTSLPTRRSSTRWLPVVVSAVVLIVIDLVAVFLVGSAFLMTPYGPWDDDVLTAIQISAVLGGVVATFGTLLRILPVAMRWLRWWWFLPSTVLLLAAITRFWWISLSYPQG